jgi:hypothetical protein
MISEESIDNFMVVGDSEFHALRCTGDYEVRGEDCLFRQEGTNKFFHVMRRSEWNRLQREVERVDAEIAAQDAENDWSESDREM